MEIYIDSERVSTRYSIKSSRKCAYPYLVNWSDEGQVEEFSYSPASSDFFSSLVPPSHSLSSHTL